MRLNFINLQYNYKQFSLISGAKILQLWYYNNVRGIGPLAVGRRDKMFKVGDRVFHKSAGINMQGNIIHINEEDGSVTVKWEDCTCSHGIWTIALVEN